MKFILASASPRRQELLRLLVDCFDIVVPQVDEAVAENTPPKLAVETLALRKAQAVGANDSNTVVIAADTLVCLDGQLLGKPQNQNDAKQMLQRLAGSSHQVYTGVAVARGDRELVFSCCTDVEFAPMDKAEIDWYVATGEPMDKAGAYGIQDDGARFIRRIVGDYYNVMGLPVQALYTVLKDNGFLIIQ